MSEEKSADQRLADVAREVVDARGQMIKNANALGSLAVEVRQISRRLEQQQRVALVQMIASYGVVVVVLWGAFYFVYKGRVDQLQVEKAVLERQYGAAKTELERARERGERRAEAESRALEFYQRLNKGRVREAIAAYPKITKLPLSKVEAALFAQWVQRRRGQLGYSSYAAGMRAVQQQDFKVAVDQFARAIETEAEPPYAASLHYYRGIALTKLGSYVEAAEALRLSMKLGSERLVTNQVRYHLASCYEMLGRREEAGRTYRAFLKRFPNASHARLARRRLRALSKKR